MGNSRIDFRRAHHSSRCLLVRIARLIDAQFSLQRLAGRIEHFINNRRRRANSGTFRDRFSLRQRFCFYIRSTILSPRLNHPHRLLRHSIRFPLMRTSWFAPLQFCLYQPGDSSVADRLLQPQ